MKTTVTDLPGSRARVEVEVTADDVNRSVQRAARGLAREMRLPGFRKGKAPPSLVIQRVGFDAVIDEAVREALPGWYEKAIFASGVSPIGDPEVEVTEVPKAAGEPLAFKFEVGVRPEAQLGEYLGLEVGRADAEVPDDVIEQESIRMQEGFAKLEAVERAAGVGDVLMVDFVGSLDDVPFEGGEAKDYMLEIGTNQLIDDFEDQLIGASAGEQQMVEVTFPEEYGAEHLAGQDAVFAVSVKEVREKILPELDDEFASDASDFETIEELRADIRSKLAESAEERIEADFKASVIDAAVENATVVVPGDLATARAAERWDRVARQLQSRGMDPAQYLQMQGKTQEEIIEESLPDAEKELRREAVLTAIAEKEQIEITEEEMVEALEHTAEHERTTGAKLLTRMREDGRDALIREDIQVKKAIDLLSESAKPIPMDRAEAREKLWTPGD